MYFFRFVHYLPGMVTFLTQRQVKAYLPNQSMYFVPGCMFVFRHYLVVGALCFTSRVSQSTYTHIANFRSTKIEPSVPSLFTVPIYLVSCI